MPWRLVAVRTVFIIFFALLGIRLGQIMIIEHGEYNVLAQRQHLIQKDITAQRGEIYTSDGYPLVMNAEVYLLFVVPSEIEDPKVFKDKLIEHILSLAGKVSVEPPKIVKPVEEKDQSPDDEEKSLLPSFPINLYTLRLNYFNKNEKWLEESMEDLDQAIEELLKQEDNYFVQILDQLTEIEKKEFEEIGLKGIHFQRHNKRIYPEKDMASNLLGFVGKNERSEDRGYFGIEGYYDGDLSGRAGFEVLEKDVTGKRIPFGTSKIRQPNHGRDLTLTIKRELQYVVESRLADGVKKYRAEHGTALLYDINSGAIWAMADYPNYLPEYWINELHGESDVSKVDVFKNMSISQNYEPGSVMKPLTMAVALNESIVTPETIYHDDGPKMYSGYNVRTWNNKYNGDLTMTQILQLSNNTGAAWVGTQIGFDRYDDYVQTFRLGQATGIDLQGEEAGIVRPRSDWRDIDLANMSFGQGISTTPIQLVSIFASLVNGGRLYQPYVVEKFTDEHNGQAYLIQREPKLLTQVLKEETSEKIRLMLRKVVTDGEFKWFVKQSGMDRYSIGGKTGTAQIPVNGRYDPNKTNVTFLGFSPVDKPKFVLLVQLHQPATSTFSADTAVPLWMDIARELMVYFQIPADQ